MSRLGELSHLLDAVEGVLLAEKQARRKREIAALEKALEPAIANAFRIQGDEFERNLGKLRDKPVDTWEEVDWLPLLDRAMSKTAPLFVEPWKVAIGEAIIQGVRLTAEEVGVKVVTEAGPIATGLAALTIKFGLKNPRAVEYLKRWALELIKNVEQTTIEVIRGILASGVSEGQSYDQMAESIIARFAEFAVGRPQEHIDSRAHLVVVTEVGNAYSYGNYVTGEELRDQGLTMEKKSDTMGDERVCPICDDNQAAGWIPFDDEFPSGHLRPLFHPACRCDVMMRVAPR